MSDCHIWLGVARSKKRGRVRLRCFFFLVGGMRWASCKRCRTVPGLADKKNHRRSNWERRCTPKAGCSRFRSRIFSVTGPGSVLTPRRPLGRSAKACGPPSL